MDDGPRKLARALFEAGVAAADPQVAVVRSLHERPLRSCPGRVFCIALGKAAPAMAEVVISRLRPERTLVVTTAGSAGAGPLPGAELFVAGHPFPDEAGLEAAREVRALARSAGAGDHLVVLVSGGGSALLPAPAEGLSLDDKIRVSRLLLGAGLDITRMNLVRQNLSFLKGGRLALEAAPAMVTALILSDVPGDDLRVVASGPTLPPIGTRVQARACLQAAGIWDEMPEPVRRLLSAPEEEALRARISRLPVENRLIGSNRQSLEAMAAEAPGALVSRRPLVGDVAEAAQEVISVRGRGIRLFGGETTVRLRGRGLGGRNQELALRVALLAEQEGWDAGWVFLSGGTDGRDGPTDAAGAVVDSGSLARMRAAGVDPLAALAENDSYHALRASGDLMLTGPTGTNVADLQVLIRP